MTKAPQILVAPHNLRLFASMSREAADPASPPGGVTPVQLAQMRAGLDAALMKIDDAAAADKPMPFAVDHGPTSLLQSFLAEQSVIDVEGFVDKGQLLLRPDGSFEAKFDERNDMVGWARSFFSWWRRCLDKHPFLPPPTTVTQSSSIQRIALLGDWGTGLYGAPVCAASIERSEQPDLVLHLGDVYYSGQPREVDERFLALWPRLPGATHRALNSNHEMYAGGHGYFEKILPAFEQSSSCFAIATDHFLLVGLDTGYDEHDLHGDQLAWLQQLVSKADGRKVVLFSHHQPFSIFEKQGKKLLEKLRPLLNGKKIFAWYWGHEHRMMVYDAHPAWGLHGRLVGHGGFPYFRDDVTALRSVGKNDADESGWYRVEGQNGLGARLLDGINPWITENSALYGPHGYMTLELDGNRIHERVHSPSGEVLLEQTIG